jgi:CRISPR-associated protein Csm5
MTPPFITHQALRLTPLTPIHIGCGIDFEPTNYVIDDGVLYHFDPAQVPLTAPDRKALLDAANAGPAALRRVQGYFHERRQRYAAHARQAVAVAAGVAEQYERRIGQIAQREGSGRDVNNQLEIERSAHHPHSGALYLPGTSLKGAMRTAWLDTLNQGRAGLPGEKASALEKRLLESQPGFHTDPLRLLHVADAAGPEVLSKVYFSTNHKKRQIFKDGIELQGKGPVTRRETLVGGQHAALKGELRLDLLPDMGPNDKVPSLRFDPGQLAAACNRYYVGRLHRLLHLLDERGFADPAWTASTRRLLAALQPALERGDAFLLRVGRHSGAESVTLDGVRDIRIMQGKGMPSRQSDESTTLWLAAEREQTTRGSMLPFGWLLVERADAPEHPALMDWCVLQPKPDLDAVRTRLAQARVQAAAEAASAAEAAAHKLAAAAAAVQAAAEAQARKQQMTPNLRDVDELAEALRARVVVLRGARDKANTELHARARTLAKRALAEAWPQAERIALADMLTQHLQQAVQLDWKDERKKLQIAQLQA